MVKMKTWREKDGRPIHDGDCKFWDKKICTCGLLHHLNLPENYPDGDWFSRERAHHEIQLDRVPKPEPLVEATKEEMKERRKLLEKVFGNRLATD